MKNKIIQIIPAQLGWFAIWKDEFEGPLRVPVAAWALLEDGEVVPLSPSEEAPPHLEIFDVSEVVGFSGFEYPGQPE